MTLITLIVTITGWGVHPSYRQAYLKGGHLSSWSASYRSMVVSLNKETPT